MESHKIIEVLRWIEDGQICKLRPECALNGLRYNQVLSDALLTENNQQMNLIVYSQLAVVTAGGTDNCMVRILEDNKNGNASWKSMYEWENGYLKKMILRSLSGQN